MFQLVCFGWLIFRAESFEQLSGLLMTFFGPWQVSELSLRWLWSASVLITPLFLVQLLQGVRADTNATLKLSVVPRVALYTTTAVMLLTLGSFGAQPFIYFQF